MGAGRCAEAAFAAVCLYEAAAVATGRAPTVSALCRRRRWVEAGLLLFLLHHLHHAARPGAGNPVRAHNGSVETPVTTGD